MTHYNVYVEINGGADTCEEVQGTLKEAIAQGRRAAARAFRDDGVFEVCTYIDRSTPEGEDTIDQVYRADLYCFRPDDQVGLPYAPEGHQGEQAYTLRDDGSVIHLGGTTDRITAEERAKAEGARLLQAGDLNRAHVLVYDGDRVVFVVEGEERS